MHRIMIFSYLTMISFLALLSYTAFAVAHPHLGTSIARQDIPPLDITYILPIWEGALANHAESDDLAVLTDMKTRLGIGGPYTKLGWSFSSWSLSRDISGVDKDYAFDPTNLQYMLGLAKRTALPILVHMNNGRWADCCTPNSSGGWGDALLDLMAAYPNTTVLDNAGVSQYGHNYGSNFFTLSRLNDVYRTYKKRNVQAAAKVLVDWTNTNSGLFAGVSLDSETIMPASSCDFNPLAIEEWKMWLRNTGIYGPGGSYFGTGRVPAFSSIDDFNTAMGTTFTSWETMTPPTSVTPGNTFFEEWERWRVILILHAVSDETLWLEQAGIDRTAVYGHQTPRHDDYGFADSLETFTAANGAGGFTNYGWQPANYGEVTNAARGQGRNNYGNFELNPLTTDEASSYNNIVTLFNKGMKILCPNAWEDLIQKDQYSIFGSPNFGDTFGNALKKFFTNYGNTKRDLQPPPWNPGRKVHDLYDRFSGATLSGPDNHLEPACSVGSVIRRSVYSAVGGMITYSIALPSVSEGQRLNFWTSLGIKDGAGPNGGETTFQVTINGQALYGPGLHFHKNYWTWKRWVPMMTDITAWAGQTVTLTMTTTGNSYYGWATWGAPAIYASATGNDLAFGKTVTASSSDGGSAWNPSYLTDGNIDGGSNGRSGWSSTSHSSSSATEWVQVDLGSNRGVGKVVLFSRSDIFEGTGSGFPVDFKIQGSTDGSIWSDLLTETGYPGAQAGDGQIFTFPGKEARYVRVTATKLGGAAGEAGYRFQLVDLQVYE
ncbi:hypothetical protein BJ875DRAFT_544939 [Amylocarpus encephaloides]|uniref:F5/8 type C domain-containing protein n=1 Tax=Amylocarpus encephaloides TaxID=45428 RepID=A0A9P7YEP9_9HELO|nr:hypothetical protein BJ875DRAFT_544939 [Amylocarpus encephaloides]